MTTRQEQILVHLYGFARMGNEYVMPYGTTQEGIADSIGISRSQVSTEIKRLGEKGFVQCEMKHSYMEGRLSGKIRKCYRLNAEGTRVARDLIATTKGAM